MTPHDYVDDGDGNCAVCALPRGNRAHSPAGAATLPDPGEGAPRTGMNHPATSIAAAVLTRQQHGSVRAQVLDTIATRGVRGATDLELERLLSGRHQTVSSARNSLMVQGWITAARDAGNRPVTRASEGQRPATVWVLSPEGRHQYDPEGHA